MAPSNFVPTVGEGVETYASKCNRLVQTLAFSGQNHVQPAPSMGLCSSQSLNSEFSLHAAIAILGVWQGREEAGNPSQKHDVELIKDNKR